MSSSNLQEATVCYAAFLRALGLSESDTSIEESARSTSELMASWMRGVEESRPELSLMEAPDARAVEIRDVPFYSFCAHHFVPFFGTVSILYFPEHHIAGLGGFSRVIEYYARRPQFQERLGTQIAQHLFDELCPKALRVQLSARQMCLELQGKGNQIVVNTSHVLGDDALIQ